MNSHTVYDSILAVIEEHYPAVTYPAENAFLRERYTYESRAMDEAANDAYIQMSRVEQMNPQLDESHARAIGLEQYLEEFGELIHDEALEAFAVAA